MRTVRTWWLFLYHETSSITFFIPLLCLLKLDIFILWLLGAISCSISVKVTQNPWTITCKILIFLLLFYILNIFFILLLYILKNKIVLKLDQSKENKNVSFKKHWNGMFGQCQEYPPFPLLFLVAKINLSQISAVGEGHLACGNRIFWQKMFSSTLHAAFSSRFSVCSIHLRAPARWWLWEACEYSLVVFQINFSRCTYLVP